MFMACMVRKEFLNVNNISNNYINFIGKIPKNT